MHGVESLRVTYNGSCRGSIKKTSNPPLRAMGEQIATGPGLDVRGLRNGLPWVLCPGGGGLFINM